MSIQKYKAPDLKWANVMSKIKPIKTFQLLVTRGLV